MGSRRGSAATIPSCARTPLLVVPRSQYAVAVMRSIEGRATTGRRGARGPAADTSTGASNAAKQSTDAKASRTRRAESIRVPWTAARTAEPEDEEQEERGGDERTPPRIESDRAHRQRAALDRRHDGSRPRKPAHDVQGGELFGP